MPKICPKSWSQNLINFGKLPKTAIHASNSFAKNIFELIFSSEPTPFLWTR